MEVRRVKINSLWMVLLHLLLIMGAIVMLLPLFWAVSSSFKTLGEIFNYPPEFIPRRFMIENYSRLFFTVPFARWYLNSLMIATLSITLSVFFSSLAGFGFAKYDFRLREPLFFILIGSLMIPFYVILVPLYVMIVKFRWMDSYYAMVVPFMAPAFGIFLMRQYMASIPSALLDSARIDGCSEFAIYFRIILPLSKPVLGAFAIFQFVFSWNNFLWPLIVLRSQNKLTLPIGLANLLGIHFSEYGMLMAGSVLVVIPVVILFLMMQKQFISGLTLGSVKE